MEQVQFRCAYCHKLYCADKKDLKTQSPRFQCVVCKSYFGFSWSPAELQQEIQTFKIEHGVVASSQKERDVVPALKKRDSETMATIVCPHCQNVNPANSAECSKCGVIFSKIRKLEGRLSGVSASPDLNILWQKVVDNYENKLLHEEFIQQCLSVQNLPFASQQYRAVLESNPSDVIATEMRDKIINIATLTYVPPPKEMPTGKSGFTVLVIFIGLLLALTGIAFGSMKSVSLIGALIAGLGFGMRYYLKNKLAE